MLRDYEVTQIIDEFSALAPPQPAVFAVSRYQEIHAWILGFWEWEKRQFDIWVHYTTRDCLDAAASGRSRLESAAREARRLLEGDATERPPRRMPSLTKIAQFHDLGDDPACVRCGYAPPVASWREASGYLERAHMIDRVHYGLDGVQNIMPLCGWCHRRQPIFLAPAEALAWFGLSDVRLADERHAAL